MLSKENTAPKRSRDIFDYISIKKVEPSDDGRVADLLVRSFTETYRRKLPHIPTPNERVVELRAVDTRRRDGHVYLLELGYRIVGTAALIRPGERENESWIANAANLRCLAIDPDFHGLGLSELLLDEAERMARRWSVRSICLHVQSDAIGVARLYQQRGFLREPSGDMICTGYPVDGYYLPLTPALTTECRSQ